MPKPLRVQLFALVILLLPLIDIEAAEPVRKERFQPNYVAVEKVALSTPNGKPLGTLKKGTLVFGREVGQEILDVKSARGIYGFAPSRYFSRLGSSIPVTPEAKKVAESSNRFAFDLYRETRRQEGNLFLSPASVATALAMTYAGAAGQTEAEMATVLHFERGQKTAAGFSTLLELLNSTGNHNGYSLNTANRLWGAQGYEFERSFLELTRDRYRAELTTLDFSQTEQSREIINEWVELQTRNKIVELIPSGTLNPNTKLVLTNAIHFESSWDSVFPKDLTKKAPFRLSAEKKLAVLTMQQQARFRYTADEETQVLELPYKGKELSMIVILPKKVDGLSGLESRLSNDRFIGWTKKLRGGRPVETYLPRFKMRSLFRLSTALKSLGMNSAFSDNADFSGISQAERLMLSAVIHQAFVDVDESGTEAAAATAVLLEPTSAPSGDVEPPQPIIFRADHPFLFVIRDNRTGAILFIGRVLKPEV